MPGCLAGFLGLYHLDCGKEASTMMRVLCCFADSGPNIKNHVTVRIKFAPQSLADGLFENDTAGHSSEIAPHSDFRNMRPSGAVTSFKTISRYLRQRV